jgi:hypothetical protein
MYENSGKKVIEVHAPMKRRLWIIRPRKLQFSKELRNLKKNKRTCEHLWKSTKLEVHRDNYKRVRNEYIACIRKETQKALQKDLQNDELSSRQLWNILAERTGKTLKARKRKMQVPIYSSTLSAQRLANAFKDKVHDIVHRLQPFIIEDPDFSLSGKQCIYELTSSTPNEIARAISQINSTKVSPEDTLPISLLKRDRQIAHFISFLCNLSFSQAIYPSGLKKSIITPVIKKDDGDKNDASNYRPISNLKVIGKIIEQIAASRLTSHIEKTSFLHPNQSAYRSQFSTETATMFVSSEWRLALDKGEYVCVASLDVSAAFDTINHKILLNRLLEAGIVGKAHQWFSSYLSNRISAVKYDNEMSQTFSCEYGVPQGSILGPILFNLYMASLARTLQEMKKDDAAFNFHIYADDVLLYYRCKPEDLVRARGKLLQIIQAVETWMKENSLLLNTSKTDFMMLYPGKWKHSIIGEHNFRISGSLRWLGVDFDIHLSMEDHVKKVCHTCFGILRMIRRIRNSLDINTAKLLCNALIISRLDYCCSILNNANKSCLLKLQKVMNWAARIVMKCPRSAHITPLLNKLKWLPFNKLIIKKVTTMTFKILNSNRPQYLRDRLSIYVPRRTLRSMQSSGKTLVLGMADRNHGRGSWTVYAPKTWNALPENVRNSKTMKEFQVSLIKHLETLTDTN